MLNGEVEQDYFAVKAETRGIVNVSDNINLTLLYCNILIVRVSIVPELSVLGWNAKVESVSAVKDLIQRRRDVLNLTDDPLVYNATIQDITFHLKRNPVKYCVLVVDAEKVKEARDSEKGVDYLKLLQTAETNVGKVYLSFLH